MSVIELVTAGVSLGALVMGGGGVLSIRGRWRDLDRAQAVRDANIDQATRAVLGDASTPGMVRSVERHGELLDQIMAELHPNSGSSLRDAVDQTAAAVESVNKKLDRHIRSEAQARRRIREALEKRAGSVEEALVERQHAVDR